MRIHNSRMYLKTIARPVSGDEGGVDISSYQPQPADTSGIVLSDDLLQLAERMAENVHDVWASTRFAQGWTYGPERDDAAKKHPCLIPYNHLPEEEKVYDRNTSLETLRFILNNGFEIINKTNEQ